MSRRNIPVLAIILTLQRVTPAGEPSVYGCVRIQAADVCAFTWAVWDFLPGIHHVYTRHLFLFLCESTNGNAYLAYVLIWLG
jgi:hypothetical protein